MKNLQIVCYKCDLKAVAMFYQIKSGKVLSACKEHFSELEDIEEKEEGCEYIVECPNCKCNFGVN